jgi:hypothetical protein
MTDLLKGLMQVKDPLTLFAFVTLVLLAAFRTKGVPQLFLKLFFKLLDGLSPQQRELLLKRCVRYGFASFALVCGIAGTGQVFAYTQRTRPYGVEAVKQQVERSEVTAPQKQAAVDAYSKGMALLDKGEFDRAIQSLRDSVDAVPTLAAQYTLALAYQRNKDTVNAAKFAGDAVTIAKSQADPIAVVRAEQLVKSTASMAAAPVSNGAKPTAESQRDPAPAPAEQPAQSPASAPAPPVSSSINPARGSKPGMLGPASPFPAGGKSFESAALMPVGRYTWNEPLDAQVFRYYKMNLKQGQTLSIDFKTPDALSKSGGWLSGGASIYDANGAVQAVDWLVNSRSQMKSLQWTAPTSGWIYFSVGNAAGAGWANDPGIAYVIWVQ